MIKKILLAVAVMLPMFVSAQSLKLGVVDTNSIIGAMPETTAAQNTLQETQKRYETEYNKLQEELARQYDEISKMGDDELPAIRERKVREFQDNQQKLQAFEQQVMQEMQNKQNELMSPIMQKVRSAIESVGKEGGFSLIQDLGSQIYFAAPVEDVTPLVKTKLGL